MKSATIIHLGGANNERCVGRAGGSSPERPASAVMDQLRLASEAGVGRIWFEGGEPTLRWDLRALVRGARGMGLGVGLVTNGRMLLYPNYRRAMLRLGVDRFQLSLHAASAKVHDELVGVDGAFAQGLGALRALLTEAPETAEVELACTVMRANLDQLEQLAALLARIPRRASPGLLFLAPDLPQQETGWPSLEQVGEAVGAALDHAAGLDPELGLAWQGFPRGALPRHLTLERTAPGPRLGPRKIGRAVCANSFNFEHQDDLPDFTIRAEGCSALEFTLADVDRHLLMEQEGRVSRYHCPTRDFTAEEIRRVKEVEEQVYLDVSSSAALGELVRNVRRTRTHAQCIKCIHRPGCCGAVTVQPGDPFEAEERWLRRELSRMRGRVLDVGCGEQPYRDLIGTMVMAGEVIYHGLDPDRSALDKLRTSDLAGTFHEGRIEDFVGHEGDYQHVLAMRALNHFEDLDQALRVMVAALSPSGRLLLSDMNPYGLLRTHSQVTVADSRGQDRQEHFRNWHSGQVLKALESLPLRLVTHRPVTGETSNEWFLLLERLPEVEGME